MPERGRIFSDTLYGRVSTPWADGTVTVTTLAGDRYVVEVDPATPTEMLRNLGEPYRAAGPAPEVLTVDRPLFVQGIFYPDAGGHRVDAKRLVLLGAGATDFRFEEADWWIQQLDGIAEFYRRAQFGPGEIDYADYRTTLRADGDKGDDRVQETDTISRLVYGMASAYMLTGKDDYLEVAERGVEYLRRHMRFVDADEGVTYWYHGVALSGLHEKKLFTSEFSDDYDAIPMYEQIYALAGPVQTLRATADPRIMQDVEGTLALFERFFRDHERGGYYSHIDPLLLDPDQPSLGPNRARKNWNSVGDHAPAYLINLWLATADERHADMLQGTFDAIVEHFPDPDGPFVHERFLADWTPDSSHGWQQDRAVIGHNLKIVWNLMRMQSLRPKQDYLDLAGTLARTMPAVGADLDRAGWYDVVERQRRPGEPWHRFVWHDRKAWWQQEQAILAYLLLAGTTGDPDHLDQARSAAAFYNAFFLDHDIGGVFFNVTAGGIPYLLGTERLKGSHSMSAYHNSELCYLAATYTQLLVRRQPLHLWFKPVADAHSVRTLRVSPDLLPPGSVRLAAVEVDGVPYDDFDPDALSVRLAPAPERRTVKVRLEPAGRTG